MDVNEASNARFSPDPQGIWERWEELCQWYTDSEWTSPTMLDLSEDAWSRKAGMTVGQDLSDRKLQLRPP